jgi:hypothetical protein
VPNPEPDASLTFERTRMDLKIVTRGPRPHAPLSKPGNLLTLKAGEPGKSPRLLNANGLFAGLGIPKTKAAGPSWWQEREESNRQTQKSWSEKVLTATS